MAHNLTSNGHCYFSSGNFNLPSVQLYGKQITNPDLMSKVMQNGMVYTCTCGRIYIYATSLYTHQKYECGKKPQFKCDLCGAMYHHKHRLKYHMDKKHHAQVNLKNKFV